MKWYLIVILIALVSCTPNQKNQDEVSEIMNMLIGTYTNEGSDGIYLLKFNSLNGTLSEPQLVVETSNPSYLVTDPNRNLVYAVNEDSAGTVTSYRFGGADNDKLEFVTQMPSQGAHPCYIDISPDGRLLAVANYTSGTITLLDQDNTGKVRFF